MKKISVLLIICFGIINMAISQTVTIGTQIWMTENLSVDNFRNGDPIPQAKTRKEWKKAGDEGKPAWCYYDNDPANGAKYGKLYNWYAVNDPRGLAPTGYHIPTEKEWNVLTDYLGGKNVAGKKIKSTNGWNPNGNGTNKSGFSALPGGHGYDDGSFGFVGVVGCWWSSTELYTDSAFFHQINLSEDNLQNSLSDKKFGFSVRCVRN